MIEQASIYQAAEQIKTKQDFMNFLAQLVQNRESVPEEWENDNLSAYLEGLRGFTGDTPDASATDADACEGLSWRRLAEILLAARVYE